MLPLKPQPQGQASGHRELLSGPVPQRRCTDLACVLFFLVHAAFFGYLAAEGVGGGRLGQLQKLYLPRDFRGTFCGIDAGQADMTSYPTLALAINAREIYDKLALEALCSQPVVGMLSAEEAASCTGSSGATDTLANLQQSVADPSKALELLGGSLLSPGAVLAAASTYLTPVCTTSCNLTANRTFSYSPPPSVPWASAWQRLSTHLPRIELSAWSSTDCPYEGRYCVPFPGISLAPGPDFLCLPQLDPALAQQLSQAVSQELASLASANATAFLLADVNDAAGAVFTSLDVLGVVLFISLVYGVVYMALVRFCAKPLVWLSILVLFLVFLCAGSLAIVRSMQCAQGGLLGATEQTMAALQNITGADFTGASPGCEELGGYVVHSEELRTALRIAGYVLLGMGLLWLLLVVCLRNRIRLAIAINEVAAQFVAHHPYAILVPFLQLVLLLGLFCGWAVLAGFILSRVPVGHVPSQAFTEAAAAGNATAPGACNDRWPPGFAYEDVANCQLDNATGQELCWRCAPPRFALDWRFAYAFFSLLWNNALLAAIAQCIIAGAVGAWFFTEKASKGWKSVMCPAVVNAIFWHVGSLAFGSLILAIVQFLKWMMRFLAEQAKVRKNRVAQAIFRAAACCLWCFEKCLKFLNKNAYIQIALKGTDFCTSAQNAFALVLRNLIRFGGLAMLGALLSFIGVVFMCSATGLSGYFIFQAFYPELSPIVPTILYVVIGYIIGRAFLNVFSLACDTSMQCFIISEEMSHRGDFVPSALQSLIVEQDLNSGQSKSCC
ncbi:unnamed protein product [Effrenium voratum]|nr:unnamed protein product [Effrenium voratum]